MGRTRERHVERPVNNYAKKKGCASVKMNTPGQISLPDRLFLGPKGRVLIIEFKKPDGEPTELQAHTHQKWRKLGHKVYVIDNKKEGIALIDKWLAAPRGSV